jgi:ferric-dicitrate binding protein FerR (iron transport regulator)
MHSFASRFDGRFSRLALFCAALLAASFTSRAHAEEYAKSYTVTGRADVHVKVDDGSVRVLTSDTSQVSFRVTYEGYTLGLTAGGNLHVDSRQDGDRVELTEKVRHGINLGINNRHISVEVRMPRNADLQLETGDGDVEVSSLSGKVTVITGDGKLKVAQLSGTLDLQTGDGGINADALKGDMHLRTGDGVIEAANLDGKCELSSGDGSIRLAGRFDALDIKSGDGSVTARIASGSRMAASWTIRTGDGPVDLELPKDFKATLDASTSDGRISLGVPVMVEGNVNPSRVRGAMNGGGSPLIIHTGDGSIRINGS